MTGDLTRNRSGTHLIGWATHEATLETEATRQVRVNRQ
jgi:hypothetical protein